MTHRTFRRIIGGQSVSMLGDWLLLLVLGMWVKDLTGSSGLAGGVMFIMAMPSLAAPLTGLLVDRVARRRSLLLHLDLASGAVIASLWFIGDTPHVALIYLVAAVHGLLRATHSAALTAFLQSELGPADVGPANAVLQTVRQGLRLVGPLLGAAMYTAHGAGWVALVDAATFAVSAVSLLLVKDTGPHPAVTRERTVATALTAGLNHLRRQRELRAIAVSAAIAGAVLGALEVFVYEIVDRGLGRSTAFISVLITIQGLGAFAAGMATMAVMQRIRETSLVIAAFALITTGVGLLAIPHLVSVALGALLLGAALPALSVGSTTALQRRTEPALMGRVAAAFDTVLTVPHVLSIAVGALMVERVDYRISLVAVTFGCALSLAHAWSHLGRRRYSGHAHAGEDAPLAHRTATSTAA